MKFSFQNRREILLNGLRGLAGLAVGGCCEKISCPLPKAKSCSAGFKIAICDWTVGRIADLSAFEVVKRLGADGIQVDFGMPDDDLPVLHKEGMKEKYVETSKESGIVIASFGMVALGWAPYKSDPRWEQWLGEGIDAAGSMGVGIILVPFFGAGDLAVDAEGRAILAGRLKNLAPKAEKAGVVLGLESWMSAEQDMEVINNVGSPAVKVYYDVGNSKKKGYDIYKEIGTLGKQICQFHMKDYGNQEFGKGEIDFKRIRSVMDDIGYRGWIVFESSKWEPAKPVSAEEEAVFAKNVEYLRGIFPRRV